MDALYLLLAAALVLSSLGLVRMCEKLGRIEE